MLHYSWASKHQNKEHPSFSNSYFLYINIYINHFYFDYYVFYTILFYCYNCLLSKGQPFNVENVYIYEKSISTLIFYLVGQ